MIFPDLMARRAELTPTRTAFTDIVSGRSVTFAQLQNQTAAFAGALINAGIAKDDRVAVLCRNRIEFFALLFACARIEAILVPLNWRSPVAELSPIVAKCQPALMICGAQDHDVANDLARGAGCDLIDLDGQADWANSATPILARHGWREDQIWYLLYTSGTTGHPKAVIQTVGMAHVNACNIGQAIDLSRDDVTLNFLPLFHTAGINLHTLPALFIGAHVLMLPAFEVDAVVALLARKALSVFFGVPAVYQALSLHPDFDTLDL
jgi:fatty-acyl-CoA synthase